MTSNELFKHVQTIQNSRFFVSFKNSKTEEKNGKPSDSQDLPKIFPTPKKATTNESLASRKTVPCGVSFVPKVSTKVVDSTSSSPRFTSPLICRTPWFLSAGCGGLMAHAWLMHGLNGDKMASQKGNGYMMHMI